MQTLVIARTLVFNAEHKLLLLRRATHEIYRPGGIDLPGGAVEDNELVNDAALREATEETGLALERDNLQLIYAFTRVAQNYEIDGKISTVGLFFACRADSSSVTLNPEEHAAAYWCTLAEAINKTDHADHKEVLDYIHKHNIAAELWS